MLVYGALTCGAAPAMAQNTAAPAVPTPSTTATAPAPADAADRAGTVPVPAPPADAQLPEVPPVIGNDEFNTSVPALAPDNDPELDKPLESIDAFEQRVASDQAGANPAVSPPTPAGTPATATATATAPSTATAPAPAQVGDAPIRDAELAKPLPPLDQFQVEPVQLGAADTDKADTKIRYETKINGLDAADKQADIDLAAEFKSLSALRKGHGKADNSAMLSARITEDSKLLQQILSSEGWYSATVQTRVDQPTTNAPDAELTAVLDVNPGIRYKLSEITIKADPTIPPDLIARNMALKVGEPIEAARVQGAEAQIAVALPQNGYAFAKVGQRDILLDQDTGDGIYTLPVEVGTRGVFGGVQTRGKLAFDAHHAGVLARFKRGQLYDSRKVDDLRQALVSTSLFATVGVEPEHSGQFAPDGSEYVDLMVDQQAGKPRTIAATLGYATGEGVSLSGSWTHRNLFPPEGALIANAIIGTDSQGAGVTFQRSNAAKRDHTLAVTLSALHATYDGYKAFTGTLSAKLSRDSTPIWQKKFTWAVGAQLIGSSEQSYDFSVGARTYKSYFVGQLTGQAGLDFTDSLLNPTRGWRVSTLVLPSAALNAGSFVPYVKAQFDASAYYPVNGSFVLAGRVRFGTIQGADLVDLAPSQRFYAGGGGSVRGYAYQKLGPLDPNGDPIGGRSLTEGSAEVRYRFGNYGIVGFIDAGQSYTSTTPGFSDLRYGVGIGGRFYTNFGPFRLDVATPINRRKGEGLINVYVSIGQAF